MCKNPGRSAVFEILKPPRLVPIIILWSKSLRSHFFDILMLSLNNSRTSWSCLQAFFFAPCKHGLKRNACLRRSYILYISGLNWGHLSFSLSRLISAPLCFFLCPLFSLLLGPAHQSKVLKKLNKTRLSSYMNWSFGPWTCLHPFGCWSYLMCLKI